MGDKEWFDEETGQVLLDIRAGVMGCEHMFNEQKEKSRSHDSIMERARNNPEEVLKSIGAQPPSEE